MSTRTEWLDWRRQGIGGSDVAAILGLSPWQSPYTTWLDKTMTRPDDEATEAQERGRDLEPVLAKWFHRERPALYVVGEQTWCTHPDESWARVTVDGFVAESPASSIDAALGGFEGKSTVDFPKRWEEDGIPAFYAAQGQWTMHVTGLERVWFGVMHPYWRFRVYELERDASDIALIVERCSAFWHDHVLTGEPPPVDGHSATSEALKGIPASVGDVVVLDDDAVAHVRALAEVKRQAKALADVQALHENAIRAALDECTEGYYGGRGIVSWRPQMSTRVDAAALKAGEPEIAAKYSKTTESRVLRLHLKEE